MGERNFMLKYVIATEDLRWNVNIASAYGFVSSGNKPLHEPMKTQIYAPYTCTSPNGYIELTKIILPR